MELPKITPRDLEASLQRYCGDSVMNQVPRRHLDNCLDSACKAVNEPAHKTSREL